MTRFVRAPALGFVLVIGLVAGWALARLLAPPMSPAEEVLVGSPAEDLAVVVDMEAVRRGNLPLVVAAAGLVRSEPSGEVAVTTRARGRVLSVGVVPGQRIERGDELARLDDSALVVAQAEAFALALDARTQLESFDAVESERNLLGLRAEAHRADSQRELAAQALERAESLADEGLVSSRGLAEARQVDTVARDAAQLAAAALATWQSGGAKRARSLLESQVSAAQAAAHDADFVFAQAVVRAEQAGQVVSVDVRPGTWVDSGSVIARLALADARVVAFAVDLGTARALVPGARAWWNDGANVAHGGEVVQVLEELSSTLGMVQVVVKPTDAVSPGPIGLAVRGELETGHLDDVTLVPERAVLRAQDRRVVMTVGADGIAHGVPVVLLGSFRGQAAVEGDLPAGVRVIVEGGYNLPDGAHVQARAAQAGAGGLR